MEEINNIQTNAEDKFFEKKLKEFAEESERDKSDISYQKTEVTTEIDQVKSEVEANDKEFSEVLNRRRKIDHNVEKVFSKSMGLVEAISRMKDERNRNWIKEYTELYNVVVSERKNFEVKIDNLKSEIVKNKKESEEKIKKTKQTSWIAGIIASLVFIALTALICYMAFGGKK